MTYRLARITKALQGNGLHSVTVIFVKNGLEEPLILKGQYQLVHVIRFEGEIRKQFGNSQWPELPVEIEHFRDLEAVREILRTQSRRR